MKLPEIGQPVTIHRPHREMHGWQGRLVGYTKSPEGFADVAFAKKKDARHTAPAMTDSVKNNERVERRLVPISYLKTPETT